MISRLIKLLFVTSIACFLLISNLYAKTKVWSISLGIDAYTTRSICGKYMERNPVKVNIVNYSEEYPYSSARFYILGKDDKLTQEDPLFDSFGSNLKNKKNIRNF